MSIDKDIIKVASMPYEWSKIEGKTLLISGGTGFLGSALIDVIEARNALYGSNISVVSLSRRPRPNRENVKYVAMDLSKACNVDVDADFILHLASNTHPAQYASDPVGTIMTNVCGAENLLKAAVECGAERFLLASSVEIYGKCPDYPVSEQYCGYIDCNTARAGYNEAKRLCESLVQSYAAQFGVDGVIVRLARCYGPDLTKKDTKAMAQFIEKAAKGDDIVLKSDGKQRFSYCYYLDAVSGILAVLLNGASGEAYNVAGEGDMSLKEIAEFLAKTAGVRAVTDIQATAGASVAVNALLDCAKARAIGFNPAYTLEQGLCAAVDALKKIYTQTPSEESK